MAGRTSQTTPHRRRRPRGSINREDIVQAAFDIAREITLDQLSMATLADRLDAGVASLYWYFSKKDDLLHAMCEQAVEKLTDQMPNFEPSTPWQQMLHDHFIAYRSIHESDEVLSDLLLIRVSSYSRRATTQVFLPVEAIVESLCDAGFTPESALAVFNTISTYTRGVIVYKRILRLSSAAILDKRKQRIAEWSTMPRLEGLVANGHSLTGTTDEDFEFGLNNLIAGFEQLLNKQHAG